MLDVLIKLLERLTKYSEIRNTNRQLYIDRYATPALEAAEVVYRDYLALLNTTRKKIKAFKRALPLLQFLEQRRLEQLPAR
ncbi:MAG TPA: hypothetical protein VD994_13045, partial [Prosthecobacter sp.]|nr:hypothetical protein [Prosthecobacter sp.]